MKHLSTSDPIREQVPWSPAATVILGIFLLLATVQFFQGRAGGGVLLLLIAGAYVPARMFRNSLQQHLAARRDHWRA